MARPGKHKAKYDRYKVHNHIAENKAKRQERHRKKMEKFAANHEASVARKAAKKKRIAELEDTIKKTNDPVLIAELNSLRNHETSSPSKKTTKGHNVVSKMRSMNRLLDNEIAKEKLEEKKKEKEFHGKKTEKQVGDS